MISYNDNHLQDYQDLTRGDTVYVAITEDGAWHVKPLQVVYDDEILIAATTDFSYDTCADWDEWEDSLIGRTPKEAVYKAVSRHLALCRFEDIQKPIYPDYKPTFAAISDEEPARQNAPMVEPNVFLDAWCQAHESNLAHLLGRGSISDVAYAEATYRDLVLAQTGTHDCSTSDVINDEDEASIEVIGFDKIQARIVTLLPEGHPARMVVEYLEEDPTCRDSLGNIWLHTSINEQDLYHALIAFEKDPGI